MTEPVYDGTIVGTHIPSMEYYLLPYKAAQEAGHHVDCDGVSITHPNHTEHDGKNRRMVCDECGNVTGWVGKSVPDWSLRKMLACGPAWVDCDFRCKQWPVRD